MEAIKRSRKDQLSWALYTGVLIPCLEDYLLMYMLFNLQLGLIVPRWHSALGYINELNSLFVLPVDISVKIRTWNN